MIIHHVAVYALIFLWGVFGILYHTWSKAMIDSLAKRGPFAWDDQKSVRGNYHRLLDLTFGDYARYIACNLGTLGASLGTLAAFVLIWAFMFAWGPLVDSFLTSVMNVPLAVVGVKLTSAMFLASRKLGVGMVFVGVLIDSGWFNYQARKLAKQMGLTRDGQAGKE